MTESPVSILHLLNIASTVFKLLIHLPFAKTERLMYLSLDLLRRHVLHVEASKQVIRHPRARRPKSPSSRAFVLVVGTTLKTMKRQASKGR